MKFIIDAILWLVNFFSSKKAKSIALLPLKLSVNTLAIFAVSSYILALISLSYFFVKVFNILHELLHSVNNVSFSDSEAYGISISTIWDTFLAFMNASGLSTAITTSTALFFSLFFSYFSVKLSLIVANAAKEVSRKMYESIMMLGS